MNSFTKYLVSMISLVFVLLMLSSSGQSEEPIDVKNKITHEKIDENTYKLSVTLAGTSDPSVGQQLFLPVAEQLCGSNEFRFGKYSLNAKSGISEPGEDNLFFEQEIHCGEKESTNATNHGTDQNWQPTEQAESAARQVLDMYTEAINQSKYSDAYKLLTSGMQKLSTEDEWSMHQEEFKKISGGKAKYANLRVTWYKDPEGASDPGIYAAFDIDCQYKNISICSEVIILHKNNLDEFRVIRHERNYIDKETEKELQKPKEQKLDESNAI